MKELLRKVDVTDHEWDGYMESLFNLGESCEENDISCPFTHACAALWSNGRNNEIVKQYVSDNSSDYFVTSSSWLHMTILAAQYHYDVYQPWVLKQIED